MEVMEISATIRLRKDQLLKICQSKGWCRVDGDGKTVISFSRLSAAMEVSKTTVSRALEGDGSQFSGPFIGKLLGVCRPWDFNDLFEVIYDAEPAGVAA